MRLPGVHHVVEAVLLLHGEGGHLGIALQVRVEFLAANLARDLAQARVHPAALRLHEALFLGDPRTAVDGVEHVLRLERLTVYRPPTTRVLRGRRVPATRRRRCIPRAALLRTHRRTASVPSGVRTSSRCASLIGSTPRGISTGTRPSPRIGASGSWRIRSIARWTSAGSSSCACCSGSLCESIRHPLPLEAVEVLDHLVEGVVDGLRVIGRACGLVDVRMVLAHELAVLRLDSREVIAFGRAKDGVRRCLVERRRAEVLERVDGVGAFAAAKLRGDAVLRNGCIIFATEDLLVDTVSRALIPLLGEPAIRRIGDVLDRLPGALPVASCLSAVGSLEGAVSDVLREPLTEAAFEVLVAIPLVGRDVTLGDALQGVESLPELHAALNAQLVAELLAQRLGILGAHELLKVVRDFVDDDPVRVRLILSQSLHNTDKADVLSGIRRRFRCIETRIRRERTRLFSPAASRHEARAKPLEVLLWHLVDKLTRRLRH